MNKKAITPFLFAAVAVLIISSCDNSQDDNKEKVISKETNLQNTEFNWSDNNVISFSDVHNPMNGYASDDPEALDTSFINILFKGLLEREDVEFLDQVNEEKISAQQVKEQLKREPKPFPTVILDKSVKDIDDFRPDLVTLENYDPHPILKGELTVAGGLFEK